MMIKQIRYKLRSRNLVKSVFFNSSWLLFDRVIRLGGSLFVGIWVARYLSPAGFGMLNTVQAITGIGVTLSSLGLESIMVRFIVKYPSHSQNLIRSGIYIRFIASIAAVVSILGCIYFSSTHTQPFLTLLIIYNVMISPLFILRQYYEARSESKFVVRAELTAFGVSSALKIIGILSHFEVWWFLTVLAIETGLGTLGYLVRYINAQRAIRFSNIRKLSRLLFSRSWPFLLSNAAIMVYMKIDQIMVQTMGGVSESGFYAAATRISEIPYFLPNILITSLFPAFTKIRIHDKSKYIDKLRTLFCAITAVSLCIAIPISLASPIIITTFYGNAFFPSASILSLHIWSMPWLFFGVIGQIYIINENASRYALAKDLIAAAINIGLNLVLIPRFGGRGAALATLIAYSFAAFWGNAFFPPLRPLFKIQTYGLTLRRIPQLINNLLFNRERTDQSENPSRP